MVILAVIILVLLGLFVFFRLRSHGKVPVKGVMFFAVIAMGLLFVNSLMGGDDNLKTEIPYYQEKAPPVQYAPFYLQTSTRAYYVATYDETPEQLILTQYYYYNKKNWEPSSMPLYLDKKMEGILVIHQRVIGG